MPAFDWSTIKKHGAPKENLNLSLDVDKSRKCNKTENHFQKNIQRRWTTQREKNFLKINHWIKENRKQNITEFQTNDIVFSHNQNSDLAKILFDSIV